MIAQQPIAVLPVPEACIGPAKQHGAKGSTELAQIVQGDKKRHRPVGLAGSGQRPPGGQAGRHRSDVEHVPKGGMRAPLDRLAGPCADLFRGHFLERTLCTHD